ncbi:MAG: response regulator [Armatimonadetes bacterium]|nr:response regulator [Armatimonadota bacterium]
MAKILIVDDDHVQLRVLEAFLSQLGYEVTAVDDGDKAVQEALQHHPDLIVLDIEMSGKDGFEVLDALRRFKRTQHTPVIVLSAETGKVDRDGARRRGATDFLTKPFDRTEMMQRVQAILKAK